MGCRQLIITYLYAVIIVVATAVVFACNSLEKAKENFSFKNYFATNGPRDIKVDKLSDDYRNDTKIRQMSCL